VGANLAGACLVGANLIDANLAGACLVGANLIDAYLAGANLEGARLEGVYLTDAKGLEKFPIQIGGHRHWLCTTHDGKVRIGRHTHTFEEWRKHAKAIGGKEGYSPLDIKIYKLHIEHIRKVSRLLWNAKKDPA
jgi:hypothetical protein